MTDSAVAGVQRRHETYQMGIDDLVRRAQEAVASGDTAGFEALAAQIDRAEAEHRAWGEKVLPAMRRGEAVEERGAALQDQSAGLAQQRMARPPPSPEQAERQRALDALDHEGRLMRAADEQMAFEKRVLAHSREMKSRGMQGPSQMPESVLGGVAAELRHLAEGVAGIQTELSRPKIVERNADGYPVSVGGKVVSYDQNGLVERIG